jgi:hypothetical protein
MSNGKTPFEELRDRIIAELPSPNDSSPVKALQSFCCESLDIEVTIEEKQLPGGSIISRIFLPPLDDDEDRTALAIGEGESVKLARENACREALTYLNENQVTLMRYIEKKYHSSSVQ